MKIANPVDLSKFFDKTTETSDDIPEGTSKLFYPSADKSKVADLPVAPNAYFEIEKTETAPSSPVEGDMYYNPTLDKFYIYESAAWKECVFLVSIV